MSHHDEYTCCQCGHTFNPPVGSDNAQVRCPRCGSDKLERARFLFGTGSAEGLTPEDYFDAALRP